MGTRIGKISVIPKDFSTSFDTQEKSLRAKGYSQMPGTFKFFSPYRDTDKRYRTGMDEKALYLRKIEDPKLREDERKRVAALKEELEGKLNIDLSPGSEFWRKDLDTGEDRAHFVKLGDGDTFFDLEDPFQAIAFAWLSVHPAIAPSLEAYTRGDVPSETQFYVNNENYEATVAYRKKKTLNDAIVRLNSLSLEKRRKIGALMDLPFTENSKEEVVYNNLDNLLRQPEISSGTYLHRSPVDIFNMFVDMNDDNLDVESLVDQAFKHQIYRVKKGGKVYEGEQPMYQDREALIAHLLDEENQNDRLILEKKLKTKKLAAL